MSAYIIPVLILAVFVYGAIKRVDVFSAFIEGAAEGLGVVARMIPPLVILMTAIGMLRASGALELLTGLLAPVLESVGMPREVAPLALLRPVSGSGSMASRSSRPRSKASAGASEVIYTSESPLTCT